MNDFPSEYARPPALELALRYIDRDPSTNIGVGELAAAAGVSVRALQYSFRRHLNSTPLRYLRAVRLARARAELLAADPDGSTTVTEVALRWGFDHPGRFAKWFSDTYGIWPAEALASEPDPPTSAAT